MRCFTKSSQHRVLTTLLPALLVALFSATAFGQGGQLTVNSIEKDLFDRINGEREKANVGKRADDPSRLHLYVPNAKLFATARKYAKFMADRGQGVSHSMDGRMPWERAWAEGYPQNLFVLENIGGGQANPEEIVHSWMTSRAGHRKTIMDPKLTEIGLGNAKSADGTNVWVLLAGGSPEAANPPRLVLAANEPPPPTPQPGVIGVSQSENDLFDRLNQARLAANLPAFKPNTKLFIAARNHASHMAFVGFVSHTLDGKNPIDRARLQGYPGNVDEVYNGGANHADRVVRDWLGRRDLAAKILNPNFTELGIGFDRSSDSTKVWNIVLGNSAEASNPPRLKLL